MDEEEAAQQDFRLALAVEVGGDRAFRAEVDQVLVLADRGRSLHLLAVEHAYGGDAETGEFLMPWAGVLRGEGRQKPRRAALVEFTPDEPTEQFVV